MTGSWDLIGWALIAGASLLASTAAALAVGGAALDYARYRATRNTPPAVGQIWLQDDDKLYVDRAYDDGSVGLCTAHPRYLRGTRVSWCDTPDSWRQRVRGRRLILTTERWQ